MNDRGFLILKIFNPLVFKNDSTLPEMESTTFNTPRNSILKNRKLTLIHSYLITGIKKHKNGENKDIIEKQKTQIAPKT